MSQPPKRNNPSTIWQAYRNHHGRALDSVRPALFGHFSEALLGGIETRAAKDPGGAIAAAHRDLLTLLQKKDLHQSEPDLEQARAIYTAACRATFPATMAFNRHSQELAGLTHNASLTEIDSDLLREIDLLAHDDPAYGTFVGDMVAKLGQATSLPDIVAYNQFFEIYAEAMVLHFLRGRGIRTSRVTDAISAPDFRCELEDGRPYFVEVKSLDIVGGAIRHKQIMEDGLEPNVEIERQLRAGCWIASATSEIAPYRRAYDDTGYDAYSVKRIIDTLREKSLGAFKASQFERGPTFALVVADRLVLQGWKSALVPYYYDEDYASGSCLSGVIWQAAFGTVGTPVLRKPDFEGKPSLEGHLDADGLYVDVGRHFPGDGLLVLQKSSKRRLSYGLRAPIPETETWSSDDAEEALSAMCDAWNDHGNSRGFALSKYEIEM